MKTIAKIALALIILVVHLPGTAQNPERFPRLHDRMVQAKLHEIKLSLKLDQASFEAFRPIYMEYEREVSGVNFRNLARFSRVNADSLSTVEAEQLIDDQLYTAKKLISIREKYYKEFRRVISPQQIIKLYQTEAELRKKVLQELKRRMMSR